MISAVKKAVVVVSLLFTSTLLLAAPPKQASPEKEPLVIGYYQGGDYIYYKKILLETVKSLMALGYVEKKEIPEFEGEEAKPIWDWLVENAQSDKIQFSNSFFVTANWNDRERQALQSVLMDRLNAKEVDLVLAMGTWAGQDLATDNHSVPTLVLSTTEPVLAGIVPSADDSGFKHVNATVDPERYQKQIKIFHDYVPFKKLGVAFENTVEGRSYAALQTVYEKAKILGFEVVECHTISDTHDQSRADSTVLECIEKLSNEADAIYLTAQGGVHNGTLPAIVKIANEHHVPTFSQTGGDEVRHGVMLSLSQAGFKYVGRHHAETVGRVWAGELPGDISQIFQEPVRMAINLESAEAIGFNPPIMLLGLADEIYTSIEP